MGPKRRIITNWEPYFVVYFQITLASQRHSSMLVNKNCTFCVNELSIGPCATYRRTHRCCLQLLASPLTKWNLLVPCNIGWETWCVFQNWNGIFPTSELSFTWGFMNELMTDWWRIINYKQYFVSSGVYFGLLFQTYHHGPYNSKMNRY